MEKFLQTCFLVPIAIETCLTGSPSSAQSKVADSPGVDLLHKVSDPNRGGETLSDTFLKEETASLRASARSDVPGLPSPKYQHCSAVDCGPWTVDNFQPPTSSFQQPKSMKKILQTCFLALLCLAGSPSSAQSRVADSPGADFLHRSGLHVSPHSGDTHRGGETLSDTFPSEFSLIDRYLDSGAGEEIPSLHPAPVTVFAHQFLEDLETIPKTSDTESLGSCFLDLASPSPAVIYVETLSSQPIDSLEFRIWDPYLNELDVPKPVVEKVALTNGTLFDGSRGAKVVQWESPPLTGYGRVTLRNGKHTFLDRFLVEPGDSVRIVFDLQTAKVLFSGPAAEKFKCQYELIKALENEQYDRNPIMFTWTSDFWGYSPEDSLKIKRIKEDQSSIRRSMEYLASDDNGISYLERQFATIPESHPALEVTARYRGRLQTEFLQVLEADILGKLYNGQVTAFSTLYKGSKEKETYRQFYRDHIAGSLPEMPKGSEHSAFYPEFLYQRLVIQSVIEREPLRNLLAMIPQPVRDQVDAIYILKNYRKFKDSNLQFELALQRIETPWISELIGTVYTAQRIGEPLAAIPLTTVDGDSLILAEDSGKIRFLHFWLPGCEASSGAYKRLVAPVEAHFSGDDQVEFVYVSHDDNPTRWLSNIQSGDFATAESLNLNAPSSHHPFLKYYNIHNYPTYMVLGKDGTVVSVGNIPRTPETLIQFLDSLKKEVPPIPNPQTK